MTSRNLVRLAGRSVAASAPAIISSSSGGTLPLSRAGGRPLRATSPPPPASIPSRLLRATSPPPAPISSASCWESRTLRNNDEDWEDVVVAAVDADAPDALQEATEEHGVVFGVAPTEDEVRAALASIKQVFEKASALDSEGADIQALTLPIGVHPSSGLFVNHFALNSDASKIRLDEWTEPARLVLNSSVLLPKGHQSVLDAFHLLHENAFVQKIVMSLTTDNNVWDVVMKNKVVQEFKRSFQEAKKSDLKGRSTASSGFMMWVLENTKAIIEKILGLVNMLFQTQTGGKEDDFSDDIVKMSFMLSVFVFIVVTISRIR